MEFCTHKFDAKYEFRQLFRFAEMFRFFLARDCLAKHESDSHRQWNIGEYSGDSESFAGSYGGISFP